ncbi:MAG: Eco57I restriction-modification methylase domain-containing protein, partial [Prolixibacteraceae bacterium]
MDLSNFLNHSFFDALKHFFEVLKVPVNYIDEHPAKPDSVLSNFNPDNKTHQLIDDVYAFGMVNDAIFNEKETFDNLEQVKAITEDYDGILIFGVTLQNRENNLLPTRSQLADIARAFNRSFPYTPVVVVFKYQNYIAFANTERTKFIQEWREGEKVGKVSLMKDIRLDKTHQGHVRILKSFSVEAIREYDRKNKVKDFAGLYKGWMNVFNTNVLNEQFYKDYQKLSVQIIREIYPKQINDKLKAHQGVLNLLNRIMFIYFIQKKDWVMNDLEFLFHFWQDYQTSEHEQDTFHKCWLNTIFFSAFNGNAFKEPAIFRHLPKKYHIPILNFPYLNGGLFTKNEDLDDFILPDELFERIYHFFQGYIFTISEDTPEEINLEINPELLGKMYEGMINATDLNDVDAEHGIIYTERPEINFMVRRSFIEVLNKKLNGEFSREFLYHLCFDKHSEKLELLRKYKADASVLRNMIMSITSLDPACGSGSILLGVIQLQIELLSAIDEYAGNPHTTKDDFNIKKQIISECIYGVDIKEWAVRIAELRFWLYMITEVELTTEELTQNPLLPNLDFKLRQGNSLLQRIGSREFSLQGLKKGKTNAGAVRKLTRFISKKKAFITNQVENNTSFKKLKEEELFIFKEYIHETIIANNQEIQRMSKGDGQKNIFGYDHQDENIYAERIAELENENRQLNHILSEVNKTGRLPFSYDIDFMEIFLTSNNPGFDLVIGNPPYVRQEDILPADNAVELERLLLPENKAEKTRVSKEYKEILSNKVFELYPFLSTTKGVKTLADKKFKVGGKEVTRQVEKTKQIPVYGKKVPGRSDLYVYFQLICPSLLNNKGTFCFIISNSWLDVEYGGFVQHFLLKHSNLYAIYDCNVRSFSASVNTVIYLHGALVNTNLKPDQYKMLLPGNEKVRFIMNKANYTDTAYAPLLIEQEHCSQNTFRKHYRIIVKKHRELWEEGYDEENNNYKSDKW